MPEIRFDDGAAYERYMGVWSKLAGEAFLDWLAPSPGLRWLDVGCGNGAFTELIAKRCAPSKLFGIDPSVAQLAYARSVPALSDVTFTMGDAMALPFDDASFDAAVMPLVVFFVPEPSRGVAEMRRVVRAGGSVSAYAWDLEGGGFPYDPLQESMRSLGVQVGLPPSPSASRLEVLCELWNSARLASIRTHVITVQRTYESFDEYWTIVQGSPSAGKQIGAMSTALKRELEEQLRAKLSADANGRITCSARAHAIEGRP